MSLDIERKRMKIQIQSGYTKGYTMKELHERFKEVPYSTVRRWCKEVESENKDVPELKVERLDLDREVLVTKETPVESLESEGLTPGSPMFKAKTLEIAQERYGAGLDFQLAQAVWMVNCRYNLTIETVSDRGIVKYHHIPILPQNIDWESERVYFDGKQYHVSQLTPASGLIEKGMDILMKLTGTDKISSEDLKIQSKRIANQVDSEAESEAAENTALSVVVSRPERQTIEDYLEGKNETEEPRDIVGES